MTKHRIKPEVLESLEVLSNGDLYYDDKRIGNVDSLHIETVPPSLDDLPECTVIEIGGERYVRTADGWLSFVTSMLADGSYFEARSPYKVISSPVAQTDKLDNKRAYDYHGGVRYYHDTRYRDCVGDVWRFYPGVGWSAAMPGAHFTTYKRQFEYMMTWEPLTPVVD